MKNFFIALAFLFLPAIAFAQTTVPVIGNEKLAWEQPIAAGTDIGALDFVPVLDDVTVTSPLTDVSCVTAGSVVDTKACTGAMPAATPGAHAVALIARLKLSDGRVLSSVKSNVITILMYAVPFAPKNLRIVTGN